MKRLILVGLVLASMLAVSGGTTNAQMPIKFGFKGGINSASVGGDGTGGFEDTRSGIVGGFFASISLGSGLSLQPELLYSQKGSRGTIEELGVPFDVTLKLDYIEIPVLFKYSFGMGGPITPSLYAGAAFGFNKKSETSLAVSVLGLPISGDVDNYNEKSSDLGLVLGGALGFSFGPTKFILDVRYTAGQEVLWEDVDVNSLPDDQFVYADETTGEALDMKSNVVSVTLGMMF